MEDSHITKDRGRPRKTIKTIYILTS